jgi:hypothetical protein
MPRYSRARRHSPRKNADEGAFSAPHFGQRLDSGLPHAAQNFLLVVLSVPHLVQRMRLILRDRD